MAHLVESMAYVGDVPWHQLGHALPAHQPIEVWAEKAGMNWQILDSPVCFMTERAGALGSIKTFSDQKVLYRSDTQEALSVVSDRYQVVVSLFDQMVTFRLKDLQAATKAIHDAERKLKAKPNAQAADVSDLAVDTKHLAVVSLQKPQRIGKAIIPELAEARQRR